MVQLIILKQASVDDDADDDDNEISLKNDTE